ASTLTNSTYIPPLHDALPIQRNLKKIEITINLPGTILRAEESSDDMYASIDRAVDVLERQIRKYKTRLQKKYQDNQTIRFENVRSEEHTSELQSRVDIVCRIL